MRLALSWGALGVLVLGCSPSAGNAASSEAGAPAFAPSTTDAPGVMGGAQGGAAASGGVDGSGTPPEATAGAESTGVNAPGSGSEQPGDLPLGDDGDPEPAAPSDDAPGAAEPEPVVTEPPVTEPPPVTDPPERLENVLVFTRTIAIRHASIGPGVEALRLLGQENGFAVQQTENPADFSDDNLARYDVVLWLSTDADVLNDAQQGAFERYIRAGGGFVGVHAASATEYGWAWYGQLLGAYFSAHPAIQPARVQVEISDHPSTEHLPQSFTLQDEWYSFRANPRSSVRVLMTLDESSYGVGNLAMGDHPIAWFHEFEGGRAWYTALGHPVELYSDPTFTRHVLGGIRWAAGVAP
jgi:cytochrome c